MCQKIKMGNMVYREGQKVRKDSFNVKQLRKAIRLSENPTFQRNFRKFSKLFTKKRLKEIYDKRKRFTDREKLIALSLYKKGPHAYRLLAKMYVLPSQRELQKLTSSLYKEDELRINERMYMQLQSRATRMKGMEKMCVLLFDEVNIGPSLKKKLKKTVVTNDGSSHKCRIADHAIIFMIRLIFKKKNQPIAYKFSFGRYSRNKLKILIENIISDLQLCGFRVMATVCDHDARNVAAINKLIEETKEKYLGMNKKYTQQTFEVNSKEIVPLFDAPHLMKGIRNDLITKDLKCTLDGKERVAKWNHFVQYEKVCQSVFGSKALRSCPNSIPEEAVDTAFVTLFLDKLYKSMSGSYEYKDRHEDEPLLALVNTKKHLHQKVWQDSILAFKSMKFLTKDGKEVSTNSIQCWILTLENIKYLSRNLFVKHNVTKFWMIRFNMEPLMDFIKRIQKYGCRNITTYETK
ncbi:uncharacterized protein [Maniola hyperantus]|uniref:uncharacterized protein isoform X3 n=1 Tax=Aphantopus hyperantus TaxID=2795564 RepID=UPI003747AAAD